MNTKSTQELKDGHLTTGKTYDITDTEGRTYTVKIETLHEFSTPYYSKNIYPKLVHSGARNDVEINDKLYSTPRGSYPYTYKTTGIRHRDNKRLEITISGPLKEDSRHIYTPTPNTQPTEVDKKYRLPTPEGYERGMFYYLYVSDKEPQTSDDGRMFYPTYHSHVFFGNLKEVTEDASLGEEATPRKTDGNAASGGARKMRKKKSRKQKKTRKRSVKRKSQKKKFSRKRVSNKIRKY